MKSNNETILDPARVLCYDFRLIAGSYVFEISEEDELIYDEVILPFQRVRRYHQAIGLKTSQASMQQTLRSMLSFAVLNLDDFSEMEDDEQLHYIKTAKRLIEPHNRFIWMQELIEFHEGVRDSVPPYNDTILLLSMSWQQ